VATEFGELCSLPVAVHVEYTEQFTGATNVPSWWSKYCCS